MAFSQKNRKDKTSTVVQNTTTTNVEGITGDAAANLVKALGDSVASIATGLSASNAAVAASIGQAAAAASLSNAVPTNMPSTGLGDLSTNVASVIPSSLLRGWGFVAVALAVAYFAFHHSGVHR